MAEVDDENLVFGVLDDFFEVTFEADSFDGGEDAVEDGVLPRFAVGLGDAMGVAEALWVSDVVAEEVGASHVVCLSGGEECEGGCFAEEPCGDESGVEHEHASVFKAVLEDGVSDDGGHASAPGIEEGASAVVCQGAAGGGVEEVAGAEFVAVEEVEGDGVGDEGSEGLHEVEGEGRLAGAGLVEGADGGVERGGAESGGAFVNEDGVAEGEDSVDWVGRRPAFAAGGLEAGAEPLVADHRGEPLEVEASGGALVTEERLE